ncbi:hypothetical protein WNZ15_01015 [Roseibium sp. AS2]|uniref:hypothetical protein n=1 Tax=Roseibium sp. AS2 TaxID=3135781 RepID=UPI00317286BB
MNTTARKADICVPRANSLFRPEADIGHFAAKVCFEPEIRVHRTALKVLDGLWFQRIDATQASNFSAGVWYCKVFLGRSLSWRAVALSLPGDQQMLKSTTPDCPAICPRLYQKPSACLVQAGAPISTGDLQWVMASFLISTALTSMLETYM